jgi:hypothetical protein
MQYINKLDGNFENYGEKEKTKKVKRSLKRNF